MSSRSSRPSILGAARPVALPTSTALAWIAVFGVLASACGESPADTDAGEPVDAASPSDSGPIDAGVGPDASTPFTISIVAPESPFVANTGEVLIRAFVEGAAPELVALRLDGEPIASLPPPFEHTLDLGSLAEGQHEVVASATVDAVTVSSEPLVIVVDRTGPSVVSIEPPMTDLYRLGTVVTVTFDEPLDVESVAAPSTGLALGGGTAFETTLELDGTGTVLTITPTGPDLIADGSVELTLGGTDPAGNAVMPFEHSWDSPRWTPIGRAITFDTATESAEYSAHRLEVRVGSAGDLFVASLGKVSSGGSRINFVRVARFDGATWTPLGDRVCEGMGIAESLTGSVLGGWDFELEPDDTPVVAVRNISDLATPLVRFCRFSTGAWMEEPPLAVPPASVPGYIGWQLRQFDFDIGSGGERVLVAEMSEADSDYRSPFIWERPAGGTWSLVSDELRFEYQHNNDSLTQVRYDRLGRITVMPVWGLNRALGYLDGEMFVFETFVSPGGARARLVETATHRTMLAYCRLAEPGGPSTGNGVYHVPQYNCDLVAGRSSERRLMVYSSSDGDQLGLVHETSPGVFTDLGADTLYATSTGEACASPGVECQVEFGEVILAITHGKVVAISNAEDPIVFELQTFGTLP